MRADQFDDPNVGVVLFEDLLFARQAAAPRGDAADIVIGHDRGPHVAGAVEHMQAEMRRQHLADFKPAHAVAVFVERRRERAEPELRRQCRDDAAADAALGRHADAIDPFAGIIVHAGTGHDRQRAGHRVGLHHLLAGHRIEAVIGKRRRHHREIARGHQHRTLPEIDVEHGVDVALDHGVIAQQISDGAVAVAGFALGLEYRFVDVERAAGEAAECGKDAIERLAAARLVNERGAGDRAGIDHRIVRPVIGAKPDRIEGIAARLDADHRLDFVSAQHFQRQGKDEGLGNRLNGERHGAVADFVDVAVDGGEADAEMRRIGLLQLRNVVGHRTAMIVFELRVAPDQKAAQRRQRPLRRKTAGKIR